MGSDLYGAEIGREFRGGEEVLPPYQEFSLFRLASGRAREGGRQRSQSEG